MIGTLQRNVSFLRNVKHTLEISRWMLSIAVSLRILVWDLARCGISPTAGHVWQNTGCPRKMYHIYILNILKTMHVICMILASPESVFHGFFYAFTNTFPVMKQLGIKRGMVIVQYYFKFGSNILTKRQFHYQSPGNALGRGYGALEMCFNLLTG